MPQPPDDDDTVWLFSPQASELMEKLHAVVSCYDNTAAFVATANLLVFQIALHSDGKEDAREVLRRTYLGLQRCLDDNFEHAHTLLAEYQRRDAVVH